MRATVEETPGYSRAELETAQVVCNLALIYQAYARTSRRFINDGMILVARYNSEKGSVTSEIIDIPAAIPVEMRRCWMLAVDDGPGICLPYDPRMVFGETLWTFFESRGIGSIRHEIRCVDSWKPTEPTANTPQSDVFAVWMKTCKTCGGASSFNGNGECRACTADRNALELVTAEKGLKRKKKTSKAKFEIRATKKCLEALGFVF